MTTENQIDFKPSTRKLLEVMGWEGQRRFKSVPDETYLLEEVTVAIGNGMYTALGKDAYRSGAWPVDPAVTTALRQALPDHAGTYAGESIARVLVRAGARDAEVLQRLHPWDGLMFRWQAEGLTASDAAAILRNAGLIEGIEACELARIDAWIANPLSALPGSSLDVPLALFGHEHRVLVASVRDNGYELNHDEFFRNLLARAVPAIEVEDLRQGLESEERLIDVTDHTQLVMRTETGERTFSIDDDADLSREGVRIYEVDGRGWVRFTHEGRPHGFLFESQGTWMDVASVRHAADSFMAGLGRSERVFQFELGPGDNAEWPCFIVADPVVLGLVCARLGLPLATP